MELLQTVKIRLEHVIHFDCPELVVAELLPFWRSHVDLDVVIYDNLDRVDDIIDRACLQVLEVRQSDDVLQELTTNKASLLLDAASLLHTR